MSQVAIRGSILIVADAGPSVQVLQQLFRDDRYATTVVHDLSAAVAAIEHDAPDLIVLEVSTPAAGVEMCRSLRLNESSSRTAILFLTGDDSEGHRVAVIDAGATALVVTPCVHETLRAAVARLFQIKSHTDELQIPSMFRRPIGAATPPSIQQQPDQRPAAAAPAPAPRPVVAPEATVGDDRANGYVLIVEDDESNAKVLVRILRREGYAAESAPDGAAALALVAARTPDLILLDSHLPTMSGFDLCRILRTLEATALTPIMFVTGLDTPETSVSAIDAGADLVVAKPYKTHDLRDRVRELLALKRDADRVEAIRRPRHAEHRAGG